MAKNCRACGASLGFLGFSEGGLCTDCFKGNNTENAQQRHAEIEAIVLTTETAPNLNITKRIEIVTAECAFGMNIFKDLFAGIRDIVGGRSEAVQKTMRDSVRRQGFGTKSGFTKRDFGSSYRLDYAACFL